MPGPVYVPGAKLPLMHPPPKPVVKPWVTVPDLPNADVAVLPADVTAAWRGLWHALGQNLPWYINHSRTSRKALRAFGRAHA